MLGVTTFICMMAYATAQETTDLRTMATISTSASTSTVSLFLPIDIPSQIQASIISASPNQTAYALGCTNNETVSAACGWSPPITFTEGESTVIYTNTHGGQNDVSYSMPDLTLQCELVGARTTDTPLHGATSAVCTSISPISGLGIVAAASTLASSEITYFPVTITAGMEKIMAASVYASTEQPTSTTSSAAAPAVTPIARIGLGGVVGMLVLGGL